MCPPSFIICIFNSCFCGCKACNHISLSKLILDSGKKTLSLKRIYEVWSSTVLCAWNTSIEKSMLFETSVAIKNPAMLPMWNNWRYWWSKGPFSQIFWRFFLSFGQIVASSSIKSGRHFCNTFVNLYFVQQNLIRSSLSINGSFCHIWRNSLKSFMIYHFHGNKERSTTQKQCLWHKQ